MKTLILGGIKSGKSRQAERLALNTARPVTLIATATAQDDEMRSRIQLHRKTRPADWQTIEEPIKVGATLDNIDADGTCVVLDCLTLWLTNLLLLQDEHAFKNERAHFIKAVESFSAPLFIVSNETSMGIVPLGELSRRYCDEIGLIHQELATLSDNVILTVAGLPHLLKGQLQ